MNCEVISLAMNKGGISKSSTAEALADGLVLKNKKVLLIDFDSQCSISYTTNSNLDSPTIYNLLLKQCNAQEVTQYREQQADVIIADENLSLFTTDTLNKNSLGNTIKPLKKYYDYIIIDTPPALGTLTINALVASDSIVAPVNADIYSLMGIGQLFNTIEAVKVEANKKLKIKGILITKYNSRSILNKNMYDMLDETAKSFNTTLFNTFIRESVVLKEAQATRQSIYKYAPKSNVAIDYLSFVNEVLERSNNNVNK